MLQMTMGRVGSSSVDRGKRAKVLEPRRYEGARDAKELENFLFDMEQYFRAMRTYSEGRQGCDGRDVSCWGCQAMVAFKVCQ